MHGRPRAPLEPVKEQEHACAQNTIANDTNAMIDST